MTEIKLVVALTIALIILVAFAFYQTCFEHVDALLWENKKTYTTLIEKFGLPTILNPEKGGGAMWNVAGQRLNYFDRKKSESEPGVHLWTPIKLFPAVDPANVKLLDHGRHKRISAILNILPNYLSYDPISHEIMARFYNLQVVQTLTMYAMKITTGELTSEEIQADGLILKHAMQITPGSTTYDSALVQKTSNYIRQYIECFN